MKRNIWALGDRSISGSLDRVFAAGNLKIDKANIKKIRSAGDININNSYIDNVYVVGHINSKNSNFGDFKVVGDIEIEGVCKASTFGVTGRLKADFLECNILRNSSKGKKTSENGTLRTVEFKGSFKAKTFENFYPFYMNCDFRFDNIISDSYLQYNGVLECERFYSFEDLHVEGVNAEFIYIRPNAKIELESIVGSQIIVSDNFKVDKEFKEIPMTLSPNSYKNLTKSKSHIISISEIEGDKIEIDHVKAEYISGIDVVIGDLCIIEKVEYKNSIKISEKAVVNKIVKL